MEEIKKTVTTGSEDAVEAERASLYKTIWAVANDLRGSVDGWDFKQYVLGMLFYRYISEEVTDYINQNEREAGDATFDYITLPDATAKTIERGIVEAKGFFILPSNLFCNVVEKYIKGDALDLNEKLKEVFTNIEGTATGTSTEGNIKGLFSDVNVNSLKLGATVKERNKRLLKLMVAIRDMKIGEGKFSQNKSDAFGDVYEYLMTMYASNAGKSGGEFYTPAEVSILLSLLALDNRKKVNKVYDPACGSGSLLLKFSKLKDKEGEPIEVSGGYYGQEINITTYNLCRINMFLHGVSPTKFNIQHGDTLISPSYEQKNYEPFGAIVSNPPYSIKWEGQDNAIMMADPRFTPAGVLAPRSKADLAFIMHILSYLSEDGTAAVVCFPGIMYRGGAEKKIRAYLVAETAINYIHTIIQLPDKLFFGTSIATCIMVLKKGKTDNKTLFVDASGEFMKATNSNRLTHTNIKNILELVNKRTTIKNKTYLASPEEIAKKDYNLSVSSYVEKEEVKEVVNIDELNAKLAKIVSTEEELRREITSLISGLTTKKM